MTDNPLKKAAVREGAWTAMDYVRQARADGNSRLESLWLAEAKRRGEIPSYGDRID